MTKEQFIHKLETEGIFPETEQEVIWFDEWLTNNPEIKARNEKAFAELNEREAAKYMALKVFARIFCENNATSMCSCKVEPKKITIFGFNNDKLEIDL